MRVRAYGLFWEANEVIWHPGGGVKWHLLGRRGQKLPGLRVVDFREQKGIYILYNHHGAYYVGLTRDGDLGTRLKQHTVDKHAGRWTRFSWFGFRKILGRRDAHGLRTLGALPKVANTNMHETIGDVEALLIKVLGARGNTANMKFQDAYPWTQVRRDETDAYFEKIAP